MSRLWNRGVERKACKWDRTLIPLWCYHGDMAVGQKVSPVFTVPPSLNATTHFPPWSPVFPSPCAIFLRAACHLLSERHPPFVFSPSGSIIHPSPSSVSQYAAKGLLSFMSNQPKFVPHPQFHKFSSEEAIWEGFFWFVFVLDFRNNAICRVLKCNYSLFYIP